MQNIGRDSLGVENHYARERPCPLKIRAAGQFTVPPLCFSAGMSCSCVMASRAEVGFANILHGKAVRFFGI